MRRIIIECIPHSLQRYDTVGDWRTCQISTLITADKGDWIITVSEIGTLEMQLCIAVHELVEMMLCHQKGITAEQVDKFDKGCNPFLYEPGNSTSAPYYHQHQFASGVERLLAAELDVNWLEYERVIAESGVME